MLSRQKGEVQSRWCLAGRPRHPQVPVPAVPPALVLRLTLASPADEGPVGTPAQSRIPIAPLLQSPRRARSEPSCLPAMDATDMPLQAEMVELVPNGKHAAALTASAVPSLAGDR